jgi:error-prone DNA polymerase
MTPYAPLWIKSNGSFLEGASHPEELVDAAHAMGLSTIAITDRDSVNGLVRGWVRANELSMRLICGAQITVGDDLEHARKVVVLAATREGYGRMCRLITIGRARMPKGESLVFPRELNAAAEGLIALAPDPITLGGCAEAFAGNLYALIARHRRPEEVRSEVALRKAAIHFGAPTVAAVEVLYHERQRRFLCDVLACVRHRSTIDDAGTKLRANAEHYLPPHDEMMRRYRDLPDAVERTIEIAERAEFGLSQLRYRYPMEHLPEGESELSWLRTLTMKGAAWRYGGTIPDDVLPQLERELALIEELDYGGYFLTMWDVVEFCKRSNILCQGRGSAANSVVCYSLGITAIDPVRMHLLFERFLSRERAEPPDIDLDIEHDRREEVIQYVYQRWGRRRAAMVANVVRYRTKSAVRDVGKALGLPETTLDHASKLLGSYGGNVDPTALERAGLDLANKRVRQLVELARQIQNFPRHLSIHPGGFLLGAEPVDTLVPIEPATMEDRTVIQWDKQDIEDLGLFKVDLLGLGMLTQIHHCFDLLREHDGIDLTIATTPAEDPATYEMISNADTVGVFQIESRAQMSMLPRLRPRTFYDLVIEVAIVRPGPIQGDMVHPYLRRRRGEEPVSYPHPTLEKILQKTLGVPIFQEQVMKLAIEAAGYTPGEADQLRRDIAAWRSRGRIDQHEERLVGRMVERGIPKEFAERVFSQIRGFGEYGFPESHAASFALLSYVTSYLKCHHPPAFTCALLNAWPMGFYQPSTLVEDAKRHGVEVRPIAVGISEWDCTLETSERAERASDASAARLGWERDPALPVAREGAFKPPSAAPEHRYAIRMGVRYVKGLGERERDAIEKAPPPYEDLADFARRTMLGKRALLAMAEAGAFAPFGLDRRRALWAVRGLLSTDRQGLDLAPPVAPGKLPKFPALTSPDEVSWDYRASQHSARGHPMERLRGALKKRRLPDAKQVNAMNNGRRITYVGVVICRQRPRTETGVTFMTLEDETGFVNLVVWRPVFEEYEVIARTAVLLEVEGHIQREQSVLHLIAEKLRDPRVPIEDGQPRSRDFH